VTLSVGMAWPRSVYTFASLRCITLREATLPVRMVRMLGDCPLVEHVEFTDCRVRIAVDCPLATTSSQRHKAFLDQFLEPLARYKTVVVERPRVVLVDFYLPPADTWSSAWGTLDLDLGADAGLGALLLWAGERDQLGFAKVTLTYHHANVESMLTHHGERCSVPMVLHLAFYGRLDLPSPYAARVTWASVLPCTRCPGSVGARGGHARCLIRGCRSRDSLTRPWCSPKRRRRWSRRSCFGMRWTSAPTPLR